MKTHFKIAIIAIAMIGFISKISAQGHYFNVTKDSPYFTNGAANQVAYIDFGDIQFWGYMEVTLTSGYSYQNSVGKYTKRYEIGKNVGKLYRGSSETPTVFGLLSTQWKLGEAFVDSSNHLKIPIYHLVSTANSLTINISGLSKTDFDKNLITITTPTTVENNETRDYVTYKSQVNILDKVGIGTNSPNAKLEVKGSETSYHQMIVGGGTVAAIQLESKNNTTLRPVLNGYNGNFSIQIWKNRGTWLSTPFHIDQDGMVGIGTSNTQGFKLGVKGKIAAEEVKVATYTNWPDYVFENNYLLPTLNEVENHIQKNGHLKDIPSAKEVEKKGFFLGNMDAKLLKKIEELTLYTIAQEKQLKAQEEKIKNLENQTKEIEKLKTLVKQLLDKK